MGTPPRWIDFFLPSRDALQRWQAAAAKRAALALAIGRYYVAKRGTLQAASLSFSTLLSFVPLAVLMFGMMAWTVELEEVMSWVETSVIAHLVPSVHVDLDPALLDRLAGRETDPAFIGPPLPPAAEEAEREALEGAVALGRELAEQETRESTSRQLRNLISGQLQVLQRNSRNLGVIGALAMLVVACMLFNTIERAVNDIWQIRHGRHLAWKAVVFTAMVVYVPIFLAVSVWLARRFGLRADAVPVVGFIVPLLLSIFFFSLFNWVVPYAAVQWRAALAGGAVSGVLFEIAKSAFVLYVQNNATYGTLYGQLLIGPIILLWVYYTWLITLLGTHIAHGLQVGVAGLELRGHARLPARIVAWHACSLIAECFKEGRPTGDALRIAATLNMPVTQVEQAIDDLVDAGLLARALGTRTTYLPTRPLERLTITDILEAVEPAPDRARVPAALRTATEAHPFVDQWERTMRGALPPLSLQQVTAARP